MPKSWLYNQLKAALENLAAPAETQEAWLRRERVHTDELALDLDAVAAAADNLVESGELSVEAHEMVRTLHDHLGAFSGSQNTEEWTPAALHRSSNWAVARELATKTLALMAR